MGELIDRYAYLIPILMGVAHEFRNPMQGIMASVAILRERLEGQEEMRPFLDMIQKDTDRLNDLINQLLGLSRSIQFDQQPHPVSNILEDAVRSVEEERMARKASITLEVDRDLPPVVVDSQTLRDAFAALLLNAIESKNESCNISVRLQGDAKHQVILIRDDGEGISEEPLSRVFEPFFSTRPRKAGLGLCLADRVISAHGGNIRIRSEEGKGTEVSVEIPGG